MLHRFSRTELLVGQAGFARLKDARVAVFGIGGVGSYAVEALARAGVGHLTLVDFDLVCTTNVNRQLHAMNGTIGQPKVAVMADRVKRIHPQAKVRTEQVFYEASQAEALLDEPYDYVLDCIDNVTAKISLLAEAHKRGLRVISAMGAANKLDPTQLRLVDISKTQTCPFARDVRVWLRKKHGITTGIPVVYSTEKAHKPDPLVAADPVKCICPNTKQEGVNDCEAKLQLNGTISYMPAMFGLMMAGHAIQALVAEAPFVPVDHKALEVAEGIATESLDPNARHLQACSGFAGLAAVMGVPAEGAELAEASPQAAPKPQAPVGASC